MSYDAHKGYPEMALEDSYPPASGQGIQEGHFVKLDGNGNLIKAVGAQNEYAMMAVSPQTSLLLEQGEKVKVIKGQCSMFTSFYVSGPSYAYGDRLQVSTTGGQEGMLTLHTGGTAPIIGRYLGVEKRNGVNMLKFDFIRA